ncbi:hypothetical protein [Microvirga pudoricolor]|uniref:hypothetical protein n=1 Tax=Microvirga pudoricolor TaxID=2778729 RepID=UPI0019513E54|nr:hypothetical protein [Microvirga pudoricolor]MBM6594486.1 hypothetical protein [Microvirga pudoricolor]
MPRFEFSPLNIQDPLPETEKSIIRTEQTVRDLKKLIEQTYKLLRTDPQNRCPKSEAPRGTP